MLDLAGEKGRGQIFGLSLHFSRFCIELSLKSIFPMFHQTYQYKHDISQHFSHKLRQEISKKSSLFIKHLPRLLWISQRHLQPSRIDFYGDPISMSPPDLIITPNEAKSALIDARFCYNRCCKLFDIVMRKK